MRLPCAAAVFLLDGTGRYHDVSTRSKRRAQVKHAAVAQICGRLVTLVFLGDDCGGQERAF